METVPTELQKYSWLNLLGSARFIIILYDHQGGPLWAVNRRSHTYSGLIEKYLEGPLSAFFQLPPAADFNELFRARGDRFNHLNEVENHLENLWRTGTLSDFPTYNSKNLVEPAVLCPYFSINQPLTIISLMRVSRIRFLGIIFFRPLNYLIQLAEKRNILLADAKNKIFGYSSLFSRPLKLRDPHSLLTKPVAEAIQFSRAPLSPPEIKIFPALETVIHWKVGAAAPPFDVVNGPPEWLRPADDALLFENGDASDYVFLRLKERLPVDESNFLLNTGFVAYGQKIPNIIFRGMEWRAHRSPDFVGYSLTNSIGETRCRLRKASANVKVLELPVLTSGRTYQLAIRRHFGEYFFLLDGQLFGHWSDTAPFQSPSDNGVYFFLRPGESLSLKSFTLSHRLHSAADIPRNEPLTAVYAREGLAIRYNVTMEETTLGEENCVIYQFHDVTTYVDNIKTLETERDTLTDILGKKAVFIGQSAKIMAAKSALKSIAQSSLSVIIEGETGVGKEVLARALYQESKLKDKPFVKVDCSTLPPGLVESELFGHEKGAFTGAVNRRAGLFEQAGGGTIFLDEVGNLPFDFQAKLLGVLQDGEIHRVGGIKPIRLHFRLIVASNVPTRVLVEEGRLRQDLYYRFNQYRFELPPLRERIEDIPHLADHFLGEARILYHRGFQGFTRDAMEKLYLHSWPGNVRELRNVVLRAAVLCGAQMVEEKDIVIEKGMASPALERKRIKELGLVEALQKSEGHVTRAAKWLGISRAMIYQLINKYKVDPKRFRE